ncbi:YkyA family protein [Hazenella coriacea]|uniref:Putative cell-wall binding lipoprotein n=1 Tax=Hazenella coriacea TaxID=1179467 RepID=A0A4R3LBS9_9BACL|nr:YkyA family protein [Hazenella coriacea]TCS95764.1 putative cell-wall binding lipoprotein [Hazenella coriacea]
MKKLALFVTCIFLLSGCSLFADYYNADQLANEMNKLVDTSNGLIDKELKELGDKDDEIAAIAESLDPENLDQKKLDEVQAKITESKGINDRYKAEVQKIQKQFPDLKAKAAKLEDPKIKELADSFIADFSKANEAQIKLSDTTAEYLAIEEQLFKDIADKKEPALDKVEEITKKLEEVHNEFNQGIDKFNVSWEAFNKAATGNKVEAK